MYSHHLFVYIDLKFDVLLIIAKMVDIVSSLMKTNDHVLAQKHVMDPDVNIVQEVKFLWNKFELLFEFMAF